MFGALVGYKSVNSKVRKRVRLLEVRSHVTQGLSIFLCMGVKLDLLVHMDHVMACFGPCHVLGLAMTMSLDNDRKCDC
jgi:hypothetical protein